MSGLRRVPLAWLAALAGMAAYALSVSMLGAAKRTDIFQEMQVALPRAVQVAMAGGDRYLAANLSGFRVLVASIEHMKPENYRVQAWLQEDIAWFNPAHEDNYYIAAAVLPWNGELDSAQYVLRRAIDGRPYDWSPIFYYAFNIYHFQRDPVRGAQWLLKASERANDENDRLVLENVAARWIEKGYAPAVAAGVVEGMARQSRSSGFRAYLLQRAARIRDLGTLQDAAKTFTARHGRPLRTLDELVATGLVTALPKDPFGFGYALDPQGRPILLNSPPTPKK